jgi:hypothetical protein
MLPIERPASIIMGQTNMVPTMVETMPSLAELLEDVPRGSWVALSRDERHILANGPDLEDVIAAAKQRGEDEAVYYFNADETEGQFLH